MMLIDSVRTMQAWADQTRRSGERIALVPTMGYLHEGHLSLIARAREGADRIVVSIFVNPLQFGPGEDLARYPRDAERDRAMLEKAGIDVLFMPGAEEMYSRDFQTEVSVTRVSGGLCGRARPVHFRGVTTVVTKLFNAVKPHTAVFGEKDFQQLVVVRRMVTDLNLDVLVVGAPIVREPDGIAMSSRNAYLSPVEREAARCLGQALQAGRRAVEDGEPRPDRVLERVHAVLEREPKARIDYAELVDPETLEPASAVDRPVLLALAVYIGETRLIDNSLLGETRLIDNSLLGETRPIDKSLLGDTRPIDNSLLGETRPIDNSLLGDTRPPRLTQPVQNRAGGSRHVS